VTDITVKEVLIGVRELYEDPDAWAQGFYAFDVPAVRRPGYHTEDDQRFHEEHAISATDDRAKCWCMTGAILKTIGGNDDDDGTLLVNVNAAVVKALPTRFRSASSPYLSRVVKFNDATDRTIDDVRAVLDRVIERA
jgi:hypothetical protein